MKISNFIYFVIGSLIVFFLGFLIGKFQKDSGQGNVFIEKPIKDTTITTNTLINENPKVIVKWKTRNVNPIKVIKDTVYLTSDKKYTYITDTLIVSNQDTILLNNILITKDSSSVFDIELLHIDKTITYVDTIKIKESIPYPVEIEPSFFESREFGAIGGIIITIATFLLFGN